MISQANLWNPTIYIKSIFTIAGMILISGCESQPQSSSPEALQVIASVRTAISAKNPEWLQANREKLETLFSSGKLTESERSYLVEILGLAESGQWNQAEEKIIRLQKAQRPNSERFGGN